MASPYNPSEYEPMIDAILGVADLDTISVKRIRNAIQELFNVELSSHKDDMNDIILKRYYKLAEEREERERVEKQDHLLALQLQKAEVNRRGTRRGTADIPKVAKRRARTSIGTQSNNPFNADLLLSPQLQDILGNPRMSRPQVVKQLWKYIKDHDLQNPEDKRQIDCDEKLKALFKKKSVTMFSMNKLLSAHLFKEDELTASHKKRTVKEESKSLDDEKPSSEDDEDDDEEDEDDDEDGDDDEEDEEDEDEDEDENDDED